MSAREHIMRLAGIIGFFFLGMLVGLKINSKPEVREAREVVYNVSTNTLGIAEAQPGDVLRWVPDGDKWVSKVFLTVIDGMWRDHWVDASAKVKKALSDAGGLAAIDTNDIHYIFGFRAGFDDGYDIWRAYWMVEDYRDHQRNPRLP